MKVYFVRHGQSLHNAAQVFQPGTVELSEKGLAQAEFVAERFTRIPVEAIISSDYTRAHQTAEIIARKIGKSVTATKLARERMTPSVIQGKAMNDPHAAEIKKLTDERFGDRDFHHSDEENFHDLKARAIKLLTLIDNRPEESLLVVLHGTILRCVIGVMMLGETLTAEEFRRFSFFHLENTGITLCERNEGKWEMITWNDHAHLG